MEAAQTNGLSRACRYKYIYNSPTCEETRGADAPFKGLRLHSTHKGYETWGGYARRDLEETTRRSICGPYPRPHITLPRRVRSENAHKARSELMDGPQNRSGVAFKTRLQKPPRASSSWRSRPQASAPMPASSPRPACAAGPGTDPGRVLPTYPEGGGGYAASARMLCHAARPI